MKPAEPWRKRSKPPKSERDKFRDRLFSTVDRLLRTGVSRDEIIFHLNALDKRSIAEQLAEAADELLADLNPSAKKLRSH